MDNQLHHFTRDDFGPDFKWGVATAAYQIEGAHNADGKGPSIWDDFTSRRGKVKDRQHGQIACDFYNNYKEDIKFIRDLAIPNFRFSIAWSRVIPGGTGAVNQAGIDYYNRVIDFQLECGIEPWVTLYHWDLPQALQNKGGWTNRDIVDWFADYTALCAASFGDRVKNWMVMNEPSVFTGAGYFLGIHAPGKTGLNNFLKAIHHVTLSTASAARVLRSALTTANIGTTFSCTHIEPYDTSESNVRAAKRVDTLLNRTFIEPLLGLGYPQADFPVLSKLNKYMKPGDENAMVFDFDFHGLQNYTREVVKSSFFKPYLWATLVKAENRNVPLTTMKWEVYPEAMYNIIKKFDAYSGIKKILITENGAALPDVLKDAAVNDPERVRYLKDNIFQVLRAKREGCKVEGYFVWTLTDNFEWAEGYHPRFGLIHVDFGSQNRTIKNSGLWYRDFLTNLK